MSERPEERFRTADAVAEALRQLPVAGHGMSRRPGKGLRPVGATPWDRSVAVLPFREVDHLADSHAAEGFAEELADALSMMPGLRVRARGAVLARHDATLEPREIGDRLGVEAVVEGKLRLISDGAVGVHQITTRLVSVSDGFQIWARRFECTEGQLLATADEAARAIAEALGATPAPSPRARPLAPRALDLYLRARHEHHAFSPLTSAKAIELFEAAIALEPNDPLVLSGYAMALFRLWNFSPNPEDSARRKAMAAAERAKLAAPHLGEPCLALASIANLTADWIGLTAHLRDARERSPSLPAAHELFGRILVEVKEVEAGLQHLWIAREGEPQLVWPALEIARVSGLLRDWERADAWLETELPDNEPVLITVARLALWRGEHGGAIARLRAALARRPLLPVVSYLLHVLEGAPIPEDEQRFVDASAATKSPALRRRAFFHQLAAEAAAVEGDREGAILALSRAIDLGVIDLFWLDANPLFDALREHPRFPGLRTIVAVRADRVRRALLQP